MKTQRITCLFLGILLTNVLAFSQTWTPGSGLLYSNPATTKIGIGITNPTELVQINGGALKIGNSSSATDRTKNLLKFGDGSYVQMGEWEADDMLSFKASKYNFTNGNVGIGMTPSYKLDVNGTSRMNKIILSGGEITLNPNDNFTYDGRSTGHYSLNWPMDSWCSHGQSLWLTAYGGMKFFTKGTPRMSIDHEGKVFLGTVETIAGWHHSYLQWNGHSLVMGTPAGHYAHNSIDLKPGGVSEEPLHSQLRMYTATNINQHRLSIDLNSEGNCFFNTPGNVGIGTTSPGTKLDVVGTIRAHEVKVCLNQGCDFVFEPDYNLMPLDKLDQFIADNKHLPEVAPAAVMESEGIDLAEMNAKLLQKIEELTLYMIDQNKKTLELEKEVKALKAGR